MTDDEGKLRLARNVSSGIIAICVVADILVISNYSSADSYCDGEYELTEQFASFDCSGEVSECNADTRCYNPESTFGFDYCMDDDICRCCAAESYYAFMIVCAIFMAFGILHILSHIASARAQVEYRVALRCSGLIAHFGHIIAFIILIANSEFQDSNASTAYVMAIVGVATSLPYVLVVAYRTRRNREEVLQSAVSHPKVKGRFVAPMTSTSFNVNASVNNGGVSRPVTQPTDPVFKAFVNNFNAAASTMAASANAQFVQAAQQVQQPGQNVQPSAPQQQEEQSNGNAELIKFLVNHKDDCREKLNTEWSQVSIMIDKVRLTNKTEYDVLISQFEALKYDSDSFFEVLKSVLTGNGNNLGTGGTSGGGGANGAAVGGGPAGGGEGVPNYEAPPAYAPEDEELPAYGQTFQ